MERHQESLREADGRGVTGRPRERKKDGQRQTEIEKSEREWKSGSETEERQRDTEKGEKDRGTICLILSVICVRD